MGKNGQTNNSYLFSHDSIFPVIKYKISRYVVSLRQELSPIFDGITYTYNLKIKSQK